MSSEIRHQLCRAIDPLNLDDIVSEDKMFDEFQTLKPLVGKISPESVPVGWGKKNHSSKDQEKNDVIFYFP